MIPPLQPLRLRSINRWLKDRDPQEVKPLPEELDDLMIQAFEDREDVLMAQLMADKTWGTEDGMRSFNLGRMEI